MTDELQEVQEEQSPEAEAATETTTDEIGDQPIAEADQPEADEGESAESDQGEDSGAEESEEL